MVPALLVLCALLATGCGGERSFEPEEFVEEANRQGANLRLGESLTSIAEGVDVYALSVSGSGGGAEHSGGSLVVTDDAEMARAEFERCEAAVSLTCYRAANVVLYFEAAATDRGVAAVDRAVRALASE